MKKVIFVTDIVLRISYLYSGFHKQGDQKTRKSDPKFSNSRIYTYTVYTHIHTNYTIIYQHECDLDICTQPQVSDYLLSAVMSFEKSSTSVIVLCGFSGSCGGVKQNSQLHTAFLVWTIQHNSVMFPSFESPARECHISLHQDAL